MALHPLAERFASVAGEYERGRPDYPPQAIAALMRELDLAAGAPVLDLAAGTGKLTKALLAARLDVVAVEPQRELRELLIDNVGGERVREGLAESIPLAHASVNAVMVADAFHWFDAQTALAEIARVLVPGGGLAVLSSAPDWGSAPWAHELGTTLAQLRPEHPAFDGPPWQQAVLDSGLWGEPREVHISADRAVDPRLIADHVVSMSWVAALPDDRRDELMRQVSAVVRANNTPERMPVHFVLGIAKLAS